MTSMAIEVSTSDYRANMRSWHERVRRGEEVVVTDHGEPTVRVVSATAEAVLDRLVAEGLVRPARRPRRPATQIRSVPAGPGDSADQISRDRDR